jgi:heptosyltransferase-1
VSAAALPSARQAAAPRAILILRTSALGDVVHCLPVAAALRRAHPEARIGWVVEEPFAPLVASHPAVDEVIPVALRRWRRLASAGTSLREIAALRARLRAFAADVALDLMGNHKAGALALLSGARRRVGARPADRREPSSGWWISERVPVVGLHAVDRAFSLAAALGGGGGGVQPATDDFAGARLLRGQDPPALSPAGYVLLQPGAAWGNKRWPPAWWGDLAAGLAADGRRVYVLAGPGEEALAGAVATASGGAAEAVAPGGLTALAAWLRGARLLVGGDTGPLHLAHALGVPVLALHGPTDPARNGPYGAPDQAMFHLLPCSFCHRRFGEAKACLLALTPPHVLARTRALLAEPPEADGKFARR